MSEQLERSTDAESSSTPDFDVVVIGAGFAGLGMLQRLREDGMSARVYEAGGDVGGTWYWNRYPGACCDSMSHVYSYSFSDELLEEWVWHRRYPTQPEVLAYLNHVADKFDLRRDIHFDTRVSAAVFDERSNLWEVRTEHGDRVTARFLITAVGCLSTAQVPDFKGVSLFEGETFHTGQWPHEPVDFSGKRVGVIGTGSSGIQVIPLIAEEAEHLTVFQRTPNYSVPARNGPLADELQQEFKANYPTLREETKHTVTGNLFYQDERSALEVSPEERQARYESDWQEGGFKLLFGGYNDLTTDLQANETAAEFVRQKIREVVKDPATAEKLVPTDHPIGTKRPPLDSSYYETFNRPNVSLVDLHESPIEEITAHGIRTSEREHELDAIVFATGFDAMTGALSRIDIRTSVGTSLALKWAEGPRTYLGVASSGYPNLFIVTGPGSPSVLSNMPVSIEQHIEWIGDLLEHASENGIERIEADVDAEEKWTALVDELAQTTLLPRANSWYMGANTPGKPRLFLPYIGGVGEYRAHCSEIAAKGYEGFVFTRSKEVAGASRA